MEEGERRRRRKRRWRDEKDEEEEEGETNGFKAELILNPSAASPVFTSKVGWMQTVLCHKRSRLRRLGCNAAHHTGDSSRMSALNGTQSVCVFIGTSFGASDV